MSLAILLPSQLQGQLGMALQLFMELRKVRSGLAAFVGAPWHRPKQGLFQPAVIPAFGERPSDTRRLGAFQILIDRPMSDRATAGDLPLPQSQLVPESQDFFELSHGQPFRWQCGPSTFQWRRITGVVVQRPSPPSKPSKMIPGSVPIIGQK